MSLMKLTWLRTGWDFKLVALAALDLIARLGPPVWATGLLAATGTAHTLICLTRRPSTLSVMG